MTLAQKMWNVVAGLAVVWAVIYFLTPYPDIDVNIHVKEDQGYCLVDPVSKIEAHLGQKIIWTVTGNLECLEKFEISLQNFKHKTVPGAFDPLEGSSSDRKTKPKVSYTFSDKVKKKNVLTDVNGYKYDVFVGATRALDPELRIKP